MTERDHRYGPFGDAPTLQQAIIIERDRYKAEVAALRAAMSASDDRLRRAGERVGIVLGCDTADWMADEITALRARAEARGTEYSCDWSLDSDGSWFAECGHYWVFEDGTPVDQGMKFCPLCGKVLNQLPAKWDEFGDPIMNDDEGAAR